MKVFIDSDVVISSLLSSTGAAFFLLHTAPIQPIISSVSYKELLIVIERHPIEKKKFDQLIQTRFMTVQLTLHSKEVQQIYKNYVLDLNDAHIVAGAKSAQVKYLISFNQKHYKKELIKNDLDILLFTPALFLQYLRSR